jgi:flagellar basal body-associated protein FliL
MLKRSRVILILVGVLSFALGIAGTAALTLIKGASAKPTPTASASFVADPEFPAASTAAELAFFKIAKASCERLKTEGAYVTYQDGSAYIVGVNDSGKYVTVDIGLTGKDEDLNFTGDAPAACVPYELNLQAKLLVGDTTGMMTANYLLEDMGDGTFMFHCHAGGSNLEPYFFEVKNGVFTQAGTGLSPGAYEYHLIDEDIAKIKAASL